MDSHFSQAASICPPTGPQAQLCPPAGWPGALDCLSGTLWAPLALLLSFAFLLCSDVLPHPLPRHLLTFTMSVTPDPPLLGAPLLGLYLGSSLGLRPCGGWVGAQRGVRQCGLLRQSGAWWRRNPHPRGPMVGVHFRETWGVEESRRRVGGEEECADGGTGLPWLQMQSLALWAELHQ